MQKINRTGETKENNKGELMTIIHYKDVHNITIKFNNGFIKDTTYNAFKRGEVISPYLKTLHNIGYIGEGRFKTYSDNKNTLIYKTWKDMFNRCYSEKYQKNHSTYKGCTVCDEWYNFQNFGDWFEQNYYQIDNEIMNLDKDILCKGNKIYSPETCIIVPQHINKLFVKNDADRGEYPIGVNIAKYNKFVARCNTLTSRQYLGRFNTVKEAFEAYKEFKEAYIKEVADKYKDKIPLKLYEAMYKYEVEITD